MTTETRLNRIETLLTDFIQESRDQFQQVHGEVQEVRSQVQQIDRHIDSVDNRLDQIQRQLNGEVMSVTQMVLNLDFLMRQVAPDNAA